MVILSTVLLFKGRHGYDDLVPVMKFVRRSAVWSCTGTGNPYRSRVAESCCWGMSHSTTTWWVPATIDGRVVGSIHKEAYLSEEGEGPMIGLRP